MESIISTASSTFVTTTGFNYDSVIDYVGDLILLVIGTGLGVLESSMGWIVALAAIAIFIGLLWSAFRFFRR